MKALIYIEIKEGAPVGSSLELINAAAAIGADAEAILIGENLNDAAAKVAAAGAAAVLTADAPEGCEASIVNILSQAAKKDTYKAVLLSATTLGKVVAPAVAGAIGAGSINDATALSLDGETLIVNRPAFGGTIIETNKINTETGVISVRAGSYEKPEGEVASPVTPAASGITVEDGAIKAKVIEVLEEAGEVVNLADANIIVSGGRGMGDEENFALCKELADVLGGVVGATRPVIENGWISRQHQVGQSGTIVTPDLYVACGISGATQHLSGMSGSKYVVAINKDEDAPIFEVADAGIVGDAKKIIPLLIEAVKAKKA